MTFSWLTAAAVFLIVLEAGWIFFRGIRGFGFVGSIIGFVALLGVAVRFPIWGLIIAICMLGAIGIFEITLGRKREQYTGIRVVFEGGGIRRGLSPVEASCLLGGSQDATFLLAMIGLLEKDFIQIEHADNSGISTSLSDWLQTDGKNLDPVSRTRYRTENAFSQDKILAAYEDVLLELLGQNKGKMLSDGQIAMWYKLVEKETHQKVEEYDHAETMEYYRKFIAHRIAEVWHTQAQKEENILWYLCANYDEQLINKTVQKVVQEYSPDWLPAQLNFLEFTRLMLL